MHHILKIAAEVVAGLILVALLLALVGAVMLAKDEASGNNPFE